MIQNCQDQPVPAHNTAGLAGRGGQALLQGCSKPALGGLCQGDPVPQPAGAGAAAGQAAPWESHHGGQASLEHPQSS